MNVAFRQHCTGTFIRQGVTTVLVGQDNDGQLTLTIGGQPTYKLRPYQSRTFVIDELEGFQVEFHLGPDEEVDELIFHQPNGTFVARRRLAEARMSESGQSFAFVDRSSSGKSVPKAAAGVIRSELAGCVAEIGRVGSERRYGLLGTPTNAA